jgi:hypothetical protein
LGFYKDFYKDFYCEDFLKIPIATRYPNPLINCIFQHHYDTVSHSSSRTDSEINHLSAEKTTTAIRLETAVANQFSQSYYEPCFADVNDRLTRSQVLEEHRRAQGHVGELKKLVGVKVSEDSLSARVLLTVGVIPGICPTLPATSGPEGSFVPSGGT